MAQLTDVAVRKAAKSQQPQTLTDGSGRGTGRLLLMVRPSVNAEWYAQHFHDGKRKLSKLGNYPDLSLAQARERFRNHKPVPPSPSLETLFADYVAALKEHGKISADDVAATLERVAVAIGKTKPANTVTAADIVEAIRPVYTRGKASMADHMRGYVRSAFGWAMAADSDYRKSVSAKYNLAGNPAADIPSEQKKAGERWLSIEELQAFWQWLGDGGGDKNPNRNINPLAYDVLRIIAATGQRGREVCRIDKGMLNWRLMTIEWPKTKMLRPHVLPISTQAAEVLHRITPADSGLLFPSTYNGSSPMQDLTLRTVIGRFCAQEGVRHFTTRDLRRTWKTLTGVAGLSKEDRDRLQNHKKGDVASVHYDRYDYLREKRAAMLQWGKWFEVTVEKKKPRI